SSRRLHTISKRDWSADVCSSDLKGEYAATMAICGAAIIHVASMVLFVGLLGTWLVSLIPAPITLVAKLYILPAILGGVTVQLIASLRQVKATLIALGLAALVILVLIPLVPILAPGDVAIVDFLTILITWFTRNKTVTDKKPDGGTVGITGAFHPANAQAEPASALRR